jgi:hypothetical protein
MPDDHSFTEYCEKCGVSVTHRFTKDMHEITYNELKEIYQTLFEQFRTHFKDENEKDEREASRKLGLKVITQWRDIVKLGLSEDVLRVLEAQ